eukprot:gene41620-51558_t
MGSYFGHLQTSAGQVQIPIPIAVKKLARDSGVNLATTTGSGPNGRIVAANVQSSSLTNLLTRRENNHLDSLRDSRLAIHRNNLRIARRRNPLFVLRSNPRLRLQVDFNKTFPVATGCLVCFGAGSFIATPVIRDVNCKGLSAIAQE